MRELLDVINKQFYLMIFSTFLQLLTYPKLPSHLKS